MSIRPAPRILVPAIIVVTMLWLAGCGEDCATCPPCPDAGYRTFVMRPDGTGDRPTIQEAIDDALRGDVILLEDGVYSGSGNRSLNVEEKGLVLLSQSGNPAACYIDCTDAPEEEARILQMVGNREGLRIDGIGFRNARSPIGGAIYIRSSVLHLINCAFIGNEAESGGGLAATDSDVLLEECLFEANAADVGGGIWSQMGELRLRGCSFRDNEAEAGGGGIGAHGTDLTTHNCLFIGNTALGSGGAIHVSYGSLRSSGLRCSNNISEQYGGVLYIDEARSAVILDSDVTSNRARSGSAVYSTSGVILNGCTIVGNVAGDQGALRHDGGTLIVQSCTIADNTGPDHGAALVLSGDSQAILDRCILAYNQNGLAIRCYGNSRALVSCCDVYGHSQGDYEECLVGQEGQRGNISEDPLFCSATDYGLMEGSPCADAPCGLIGSRGVGCR